MGLKVIRHEEVFPRGVPDEKWLAEAGRRGWIVVSRDDRIRYRSLEMEAVRREKARMFVFVGGHQMTKEFLAQIFQSALPKILGHIQKYDAPFLFRVSRGGNISRLPEFPYKKIPARRR